MSLSFLPPKQNRFFSALSFSLLCLTSLHSARAQVSVLTQDYNNARTGANLQETILTPANIATTRFGKLFTITGLNAPVAGQVLYVPNVVIGGVSHNIVYAFTVGSNFPNSPSGVYAYDADNGVQLWQTLLPNSDGWTTPTPVIDLVNKIIYVLNLNGPSDTGQTFLHALDITTGAEKPGSPVQVQASIVGTGEGNLSGLVFLDGLADSVTPASFNGSGYTGRFQSNDRAALLMVNGVVYTAFAHAYDTSPYHGWVLGYKYDGTKFTQTAKFCVTPNGGGSGIWQSGKGLAADANGYIYCATGNGSFDANTGGPDYGMCYLKLNPSDLSVADWFASFDSQTQSAYDFDLGSTGVVLIPGTNRLFGGVSKSGSGYLLDSTNLGKFTVNGPDKAVLRLDGLADVDIVGQNPICWDAGALKYVYVWTNGSNLQQFALDPATGTFTTTGDPTHIYKQNSLTNGASMTISANGGSNGILWAICQVDGVFRAFDAADVSKAPLWTSSQNQRRDGLDSVGHFQFTTVANGKVFAPTNSSTIVVYGLLPVVHLAPIADASVRAGQYADTNYGTDTLLVCKKLTSDSSSPYNRADYLKFDLTNVTTAPSQASLTLTVNPISRPYRNSETINLYSVADTSWTESSLTWNNAPGLSTSDFTSTGTLLSSLSVPLAPGTASFDVSAFVKANLGKVVTFQVVDGAITGNTIAFDSRESVSGHPVLNLVP